MPAVVLIGNATCAPCCHCQLTGLLQLHLKVTFGFNVAASSLGTQQLNLSQKPAIAVWLLAANVLSFMSMFCCCRGHLSQGRALMAPYLPRNGASGSPYSEGGALYALGLIHANHGQDIRDFLLESLRGTQNEVGCCQTVPGLLKSVHSFRLSFRHCRLIGMAFTGHKCPSHLWQGSSCHQ